MKIGKLVKSFIKKIFYYCETINHAELSNLMDGYYSKKTFDINFPFCTEVSKITPELSKRYWTTIYVVCGKSVRVSSQWYDIPTSQSSVFLANYLLLKKIATNTDIESPEIIDDVKIPTKSGISRKRKTNSRYRGNAIGNAQNLVVRNILSNLGQESFTENDWAETKRFFNDSCAYCGATGDIVIEHAIPINRTSLGEHRLGNLVPSCRSCNSKKHDKDFREFLGDDQAKILVIEQYMESRNYMPLGENEHVKKILEIAYNEVATIPEKYIEIINDILPIS